MPSIEWVIPNKETDQWVDMSKEAIEIGETSIAATIAGEIDNFMVVYGDDPEKQRFAVVRVYQGGGSGMMRDREYYDSWGWRFGAWYETYPEAVGVCYKEALADFQQ